MIDKKIVRLDKEKLSFEGKLSFLTCGGCKGIFPVSIVGDGKEVNGFYDTSGYRRLSSLEEISASQAVTILEKTIDAVEECGQYLIFPEEFVINTDTAYVDSGFSAVKFTYVPSDCGDEWSVKLLSFIEEFKTITTDNGRAYLDMAGELFSNENPGRAKTKAMLLKLRHEIRFCGAI